MANILITGGRSAKTFKLLKFFEEDRVMLGDYGDTPASTPSYTFVSLGELNADVLAHNLLNICLDHEVDLLIPLHLEEIRAVAKASTLFGEFGITVLVPDMQVLENYISPDQLAGELMIIINGALYSQPAEEYFDNLSGVFYKDRHGKPAKLFKLD